MPENKKSLGSNPQKEVKELPEKKLLGSYLLGEVEELKKKLETKECIERRGYCHPDIIKMLEKEGIEVVNYDFGIETYEIRKCTSEKH